MNRRQKNFFFMWSPGGTPPLGEKKVEKFMSSDIFGVNRKMCPADGSTLPRKPFVDISYHSRNNRPKPPGHWDGTPL